MACSSRACQPARVVVASSLRTPAYVAVFARVLVYVRPPEKTCNSAALRRSAPYCGVRPSSRRAFLVDLAVWFIWAVGLCHGDHAACARAQGANRLSCTRACGAAACIDGIAMLECLFRYAGLGFLLDPRVRTRPPETRVPNQEMHDAAVALRRGLHKAVEGGAHAGVAVAAPRVRTHPPETRAPNQETHDAAALRRGLDEAVKGRWENKTPNSLIHATSDEVSTSATETELMLIRRTSFRRYHRDMFGMIVAGKKKNYGQRSFKITRNDLVFYM
uniref:Uncharacterized protein n=1 Tax=Oryza barthii TaxID=65489 RepID=A0A0D3HNZ0_9ORYZ